MTIPNKYRNVIITSLQYSIRNANEWHEKEFSKYYSRGEKYPYDYKKETITPMQEALEAIKKQNRK
jgi:tryptophanyl-tRNA synthetase